MAYPAQIYLSDRRGLLVDEGLNLYCVFNFKSYFDAHRPGFGALSFFNDVLQHPGAAELLVAETQLVSLVLPVTGALLLNGRPLEVGEIAVRTAATGEVTLIRNGLEPAVINYLHLGITVPVINEAWPCKTNFDLAAHRNKLCPVLSADLAGFPARLRLGLFDHRQEVSHEPEGNRFFAFVIAGSFEINGRLLHDRDGLALRDAGRIGIEALSADALLLTIEQ